MNEEQVNYSFYMSKLKNKCINNHNNKGKFLEHIADMHVNMSNLWK